MFSAQEMQSKLRPLSDLKNVISNPEHSVALVVFMTPTCPHCQSFLPLWEATKQEVESAWNLKKKGQELPMYAFDGRRYSRAKGVPHIEIFQAGQEPQAAPYLRDSQRLLQAAQSLSPISKNEQDELRNLLREVFQRGYQVGQARALTN